MYGYGAHEDRKRSTRQAAGWLLALRTPEAQIRADFADWLTQSATNVRSFLSVVALDQELPGLDRNRTIDVDALLAGPSDNVVPLPGLRAEAADTMHPAEPDASRLPAVVKAAKLLGERSRTPDARVAAGLALILFLPLSPAKFATFHGFYETAIGERQTVHLDDGSDVELNTDTRIEVDFAWHARNIRLIRGEALFTVEHDPGSLFRVYARDAMAQAVGTQFTVRDRPEGTVVLVVDGRVRVYRIRRDTAAAPSAVAEEGWNTHHPANIGQLPMPSLLTAGDQTELMSDGGNATTGRQTLPASEVRRRLAWTDGSIALKGEPLTDVVTEFNRYNTRHMVIANPALANLHVGGTFSATDVDSFIAAMGGLGVRAASDPQDPEQLDLFK